MAAISRRKMPKKRIVPTGTPPLSQVSFADGKRILQNWEMLHANDADSLKFAGRPLSALTFQEWQDQVVAKAGLTDFLRAQRLNTKEAVFAQM